MDSSQKNKLTIGMLARTAGIGVETVRYYQRRGLLEVPKKSVGRLRAYGEKHLVQLWLIKHAKELGFTLAEITKLASYVEERQCSAIQALAQQKLRAIAEQIRFLEKARKALRNLASGCASGCDENCPAIRVFRANGFGSVGKR
ncbi:MAG TPA: MerR family transcriptional regulator [Rhodocyclaceae bacterium]